MKNSGTGGVLNQVSSKFYSSAYYCLSFGWFGEGNVDYEKNAFG